MQLDLRGTEIGLGAGTGFELHQCIRFFGARTKNAARTVVFEASAYQVNAVCDQCGCETVPGVTPKFAAIEMKAQRTVAVDQTTLR